MVSRSTEVAARHSSTPTTGAAPSARGRVPSRGGRRAVRLEFVVRPPLGAGPSPGSGDPTDIVQFGTGTMCPPTKVDGVWPFNDAWLRTSLLVGPGSRQVFVQESRAFQNSIWSRYSRRVVPIRRSTNGWDRGT